MKIKKIQKLIVIRSARNLTQYGNITIIKSLLLTKITHVLLSLPTPNLETFTELESMFNKFLWNQKNSKI